VKERKARPPAAARLGNGPQGKMSYTLLVWGCCEPLGVWEVVGLDGKLALLGQGLVVGILPLASEKNPVVPEEAGIALQKYTEMEIKLV
jgi:hypothetical protein